MIEGELPVQPTQATLAVQQQLPVAANDAQPQAEDAKQQEKPQQPAKSGRRVDDGPVETPDELEGRFDY